VNDDIYKPFISFSIIVLFIAIIGAGAGGFFIARHIYGSGDGTAYRERIAELESANYRLTERSASLAEREASLASREQYLIEGLSNLAGKFDKPLKEVGDLVSLLQKIQHDIEILLDWGRGNSGGGSRDFNSEMEVKN